MRKELKNLSTKDYYIDGISEDDFFHIIDLVDRIIEVRAEAYRQYEDRVEKEQPEVAAEIIGDILYHAWRDDSHLWDLALLRIQGLFESIITHKLIKKQTSNLPGLKAKLTALRNQGYTISNHEFNELIEWGKIRNIITHTPPEPYTVSSPIIRSDLVELSTFLRKLCIRWFTEKQLTQT